MAGPWDCSRIEGCMSSSGGTCAGGRPTRSRRPRPVGCRPVALVRPVDPQRGSRCGRRQEPFVVET